MKKQDNHPTNFWFGFALGTASAITISYFIATKKGRGHLKKILEFAETIEENSPDLILELEKLIFKKNLDSNPQRTLETQPLDQDCSPTKVNTIENIINKIKNVGQPDKYVKRFFAKSDKIVNS